MCCSWWVVALLWVQTSPSSALLWRSRWVRALMGVLVLIPAWAGLLYVRALEQGVWLVLLMILCVVCADVGAYFSGRSEERRVGKECRAGRSRGNRCNSR